MFYRQGGVERLAVETLPIFYKKLFYRWPILTLVPEYMVHLSMTGLCYALEAKELREVVRQVKLLNSVIIYGYAL